MNDEIEDMLHRPPSIDASEVHQQSTVHRALQVYHEQQQQRRPAVLPFVASFLGAAAAITIAVVLFWPDAQAPQIVDRGDTLDRVDVVKAYLDLLEAFPEGLAALAFVDGEMQIHPGRLAAPSTEPTYVEMMVGDSRIQVVAAAGTTLPLKFDGVTLSIDFLPDAAGRPTVSGEDFYWSTGEFYLPPGKQVLEAENLGLFL